MKSGIRNGSNGPGAANSGAAGVRGKAGAKASTKSSTIAAVVSAGGTLTHHHAVGRDHRSGYQAECPPLFADALRATKKVLDPAGILNPGVLIDPDGRSVGVRGAMQGA